MTLSGTAPELAAFLERERAEIEDVLHHVADRVARAAPSPLAEAIRYSLVGGGKRLRPTLVIAAYRSVTGLPASRGMRTIACAVELIHTYSLMHDDLPCMDDDDLRRGRATTHRVFGDAVAAVAGATLIPAAFRILMDGARQLELPPARASALARELARGAGGDGMVGGQLLDLEAEGRKVSIAELEAIHARKTGALFAAALRIGGIAGGAEDDVVNALGEAGSAMGLAFQVSDDILDETGESARLGKTAGRDRALAKATFPALLGVEAARTRATASAEEAVAHLRAVGLDDDLLSGLVRFAVDRDR